MVLDPNTPPVPTMAGNLSIPIPTLFLHPVTTAAGSSGATPGQEVGQSPPITGVSFLEKVVVCGPALCVPCGVIAVPLHMKQVRLAELIAKIRASDIANSVLWGVPLAGGSVVDTEGERRRRDKVLLNFLNFNLFKVDESFQMINDVLDWMINDVLDWRMSFGMDTLLDEEFDFDQNFGGFNFVHGRDMENRPIIYVKYGAIQDIVKAREVLLNPDERRKFIRWRIQLFERVIHEYLDFRGVDWVNEISDLEGISEVGMDVLVHEYQRLMVNYYPAIVGRKVYINPRWFTYARAGLALPFLVPNDQSCTNIIFIRSKDPSSALCKIIPPHHVLTEYGGMSERNPPVPSEIQAKVSKTTTVKANEIVVIKIKGIPGGTTVSWEVLVLGWDITYAAKFVPGDTFATEVAATQRMSAKTKLIKGTFTCPGTGDLILRLDNSSSSKSKVVAWRSAFQQ